MKVSLEKNNAPQNIAFKGYKPVKSNLGQMEYEFNYTFNDHLFDCYLELCAIDDDGKGNYVNKGGLKNLEHDTYSVKMQCGPNRINVSNDYGLDDETPFAYHFRLTYKNQPDNTYGYGVDAGDVIDFRKDNGTKDTHKIYNIIVPTRTRGTKGGSAMLAIPDNYNAMYAYDKDGNVVPNLKYIETAKSTKHFSNKIGGSLAGLEHDLDAGKLNQYSKIFLTPFATDDSLTPHSYWNKNCFQIVQSLGSMDNYESFQKKLFAHGKNLVSDAALVNEGLEGIHFQHVLKWGKKSYAYNWFRMDLDNGPLGLGVLSKNKSFVSHKIINSPYIYTQDEFGQVHWKKAKVWNGKGKQGDKYDPKSPTYIQFLDKDLTTPDERANNSPKLKSYSILDTGNPYEKVTHHDTIILYSFEMDPKNYHEGIKRLNEINSKRSEGKYYPLSSYAAARILSKMPFANGEGKFEGGKEDWDANVDVAKLNYATSNYNSAYMKEHFDLHERDRYKEMVYENNYQVQDYAISSAQYWTNKTKQILNLYVAQNLKGINSKDANIVMQRIRDNVTKNKTFPADIEFAVDKAAVEKLLAGKYTLHGMDTVDTFKEVTLANMMNMPLDSIEFGDNLAAVFASPYLTKRATDSKQIGVSRYDLMKQGDPHLTDKYKKAYNKMNKLYENEMSKFADDILKRLDKKLTSEQRLYSDVNTSPYGKYVLPLIAPEIAKFAIVKGLFPDAEVKIKKDGGVAYDYDKLKSTSIQALEIYPEDPEDEAISIINRLKGSDLRHKGIPAISEADKELLTNAIYKMLEGTNLMSFKLAEMIVDRTQGGLDWRIDAAKDISDKESLLNVETTFEKFWKGSINFWKKFTQSVYDINPNSYIVAEVTNEGELYGKGQGWLSDYFSPQYIEGKQEYVASKDIIMKFLRETGITSTANYNAFFTDIPAIFSKIYEDGADRGVFQATKIYELLNKNGADFLHVGPLDSILYSYNFVDNHDKPRALHMMALDAGLFYANLNADTYNKSVNDIAYKYKEKAYKVLNNKFLDNVSKEEVDGFNFMRKSAKAVAMGDALNNAFGRAIERLETQKPARISKEQGKHIYECIAHAISDMANGNYLGQQFEADAFGTRPFDITIDTVVKHAKAKYGLNVDRALENTLKNTTFYMSVDPAISKLLGIMKFLVALPGIPTMFAGDDIGSTGYEQLTRNIYLQNRSVVHHEWLEDPMKISDNLQGQAREDAIRQKEEFDYTKDFIRDHKADFDKIMALRKRPELHALNDGAPVLLRNQGADFVSNDGKEHGKTYLPALLRHSTDGAMTISLFNTMGVTHDFDKYSDPEKYTVKLGGIDLDYNKGDETGLIAGLPTGTVFVNAANSDEKFEVVCENNNHYYIAHPDRSPIIIKDNTLNLYHVPAHVQEKIDRYNQLKAAIIGTAPKNENTFRKIRQLRAAKAKDKTSFSGRSRQLYNPQYNFVSSPYSQNKKAETGTKLSLISK